MPLERGAVYDIPYLYGTKIETDKIAKLLSNKGCDVLLFQEDKGTESLLYTLSGRHDLQMLHFATHAFWWNRVRNSNSISGCLLNKNGLFLSGAKLVWYNNRIRPNNADGILLGEEISKLDFSDLSLLVLSMCAPPIDDNSIIAYSDSSWDLVTAFKIAGTKTILYTLWSIDDEATPILMEAFYRNMSNGMSLTKSLALAKKSVQNDTKWNDPKYWASFVLIDAIK